MQGPLESPASAGTSRKAIASLILGAVSCAIPLVLTIPGAIVTLVGFAPTLVWHAVQILTAAMGAVFGAIGIREIKRGPGRLGGRGMAVAGVALSAAATLAFMPAVLVGMVLPTVLEAKHRNQSMRNLRAIVLAMHDYHDTNGRFPCAVVFSREGKRLLSWRVLLLPFLGHAKLYQQFRLDEPWDSSTNQALLPQMPSEYAPPGSRSADFATNYLVFDGPGAIFQTGERPTWFDDELNRARTPGMQVHPQRPGEQPVYDFGRRSSLMSITDGPANTILLVEADERAPWTKPQDLPFASDRPLPKLGGHYHGDFVVALADGSVRIISKRVNEKTIREAITANGDEIPGPDWYAP
jgi:Protein of unknown function (DUF1559)